MVEVQHVGADGNSDGGRETLEANDEPAVTHPEVQLSSCVRIDSLCETRGKMRLLLQRSNGAEPLQQFRKLTVDWRARGAIKAL